MISLTYLSTARAPFGPASLNDLLLASRERNKTNKVTGMLLYASGHFIQTLEGAEEVVDETFARIERDIRHRNVYVAMRESIETPAFPHWSMGYETRTLDELSVQPGFTDYLERKPMSAGGLKTFGPAGVFHRVFRDRMR